jgi:hypothetical protein
MDPFSAAAYDIIQTSIQDLRATVADMGREALNRAPAPDTNSIAVLVAHAVTSAKTLLDAALTGRMDRGHYMGTVRPAAFATRDADAAALLALLDDLARTAERLTTEGVRADYAAPVAYIGGEGPPRTRAWCLLHAVEHLREHVGHAQLTKQVLA